MSQHTIIQGPTKLSDNGQTLVDDTYVEGVWKDIKWVFGWNPLRGSFYLQLFDGFIRDLDNNPIICLGASTGTAMTEVEELARQAHGLGLDLTPSQKGMLQAEKDRGI